MRVCDACKVRKAGYMMTVIAINDPNQKRDFDLCEQCMLERRDNIKE